MKNITPAKALFGLLLVLTVCAFHADTQRKKRDQRVDDFWHYCWKEHGQYSPVCDELRQYVK